MTEHMPLERNESQIRRLLQTIDQDYCAAFLGFSGLSLGSSKHEFINHRMDQIGVAGKQLVELVGEDEAGRLIVQQMNKSADRGDN